MENQSKSFQTLVWAVLGAVLLFVVFLYFGSRGRKSNLPEYGHVKPFVLTNQTGELITLADLKGKVWLADIIFARCAGPCPRMTEEMRKVQEAFPASEKLRFVTLTTDPEHDTPTVLKKYGEKFNADPERWFFLTGPKAEILQNLAIGSLKLTALEKDPETRQDANDLFIHTASFVLIDKKGNLRGIYESLEPGFQEKVQADIKSLLGEGN